MPPPDKIPLGNYEDWVAIVVLVPTPATPVQGPHLEIPDGVALLIKARDSNGGNVFFQRTSALVLNTNQRVTMAPGAALSLAISNMDLVWFDAAVASEGFELVVEQGRPRGAGIVRGFSG